MTTTLARELAPCGVRVNAIAPLAFSGMTAPLWGGPLFSDERREELSPDNVAQVVGWLASPRSAPITGQIVSFGGRRISISQEWPTVGAAEADGGIWSYERMDAVREQLFGAASIDAARSAAPRQAARSADAAGPDGR